MGSDALSEIHLYSVPAPFANRLVSLRMYPARLFVAVEGAAPGIQAIERHRRKACSS
jgi:hypothetical protein